MCDAFDPYMHAGLTLQTALVLAISAASQPCQAGSHHGKKR